MIPQTTYQWPDHLPCFTYGGKLLAHLSMQSFREFIEAEHRKTAKKGNIFGDRRGLSILKAAYAKSPELRPWIFCLIQLFDPKRPCNLRPFLIPEYDHLVRKAGTEKSVFFKEAAARNKILRIAKHLKAALDLDPAATLSLLGDWGNPCPVTWERRDIAKPHGYSFNRTRALQTITILDRTFKGKPLPSRINDYDSFLFSVLVPRIKSATEATEEKIRAEIGRAIHRKGASILRKLVREKHLHKTALNAAK